MPIEAYEFGRIVVDGRSYSADLILYPDRVQANWWRRAGHELCPEDIAEVLAGRPQVLVVGTGESGRMRVLPETEALLQERGIQLIALPTGAACRTYNQLRSTGSNAVAALHLTC